VEEKEAALLSLRVCDPASGSGHFMLAAARRIARELAVVREGESEPTPTVYREALRDVIRSCIYAVDKNPLAIDLCKVALWIEGHNAGLPLSFLDNHIKCGDSLVGVLDTRVLDEGIPDNAYKAVHGDDKAAAVSYGRQNKEERKSQRQLTLGEVEDTAGLNASIAENFRALGEFSEKSAKDVDAKEELYGELRTTGSDWWKLKIACDLWTSAFLMPLEKQEALNLEAVPTTSSLRRHLRGGEISANLLIDVDKTSQVNSCFHWKLEFPDVFAQGGFDVIIGNPPWERIKLQEREFFAGRDREIAEAPNAAARRRLIMALPESNPQLATEFAGALHKSEALSKFIRGSGRLPLCGIGDINTYSIFAETMRSLINPAGQMGVIVPSGIATDDTTKHFFGDLVEKESLVSLYDFENSQGIFAAVHRSYKFCLLTLTGSDHPSADAEFAFSLVNVENLRNPERTFVLTREDFALINPNTRTCPMFTTNQDADLTRQIYERVPILIEDGNEDGNPWGISFLRMFDMSNDSELFRNQNQLENEGWELQGNNYSRDGKLSMPLYEAAFAHHYDHRFSTFEGAERDSGRKGKLPQLSDESHQNRFQQVKPAYWVDEKLVEERLSGKWDRGWLLGWRDVTAATNQRTVIASVVPKLAVGHKFPLIIFRDLEASMYAAFLANLSSFVLDYVARQKLGGISLTYFYLKQFPVLSPKIYTESAKWSRTETNGSWIASRVLELVYTEMSVRPFAQDLKYEGPPFQWDSERRFFLRCEIDAAFFHLYGIERGDVCYIMDSFLIVGRHDRRDHGEPRTRRVILEIYDEIASAVDSGQSYKTKIDPPPADSRASHKQLVSD
jgi:hypothetical protein